MNFCEVTRNNTFFTRYCNTWLKGTVARDFPPPFFPSKVPTLDPNSYPMFFSNLVLNSWSYYNWSLTPRCLMQWRVESLRCIMQWGVKSSHCILQLRDATACCTLHWRVRSYHCKVQRRVKSYCCMMQQTVKGIVSRDFFTLVFSSNIIS